MTIANGNGNGNGADSRSKAYATLLTKRSYLPGALVLHQSLVDQGSAYPLVVFATRELPQDAREILTRRGIRVREIEYLQPPADKQADFDEHDLRFQDTWTKLRVFEMAEYEVSWPVRVRRRCERPSRSRFTPAHWKLSCRRAASRPPRQRHALYAEYGRAARDAARERLDRRRPCLHLQPEKHSHYPLDWSVRAGLSLSCPRAQS